MLFSKSIAKPESGTITPHLIDAVAISQLASAMMAEIAAMADEQELRGFFVAIGGRIAALQPMTDMRRLDQLAERVNLFWDSLGWGHAIFELDDEGIDIFHGNMPRSIEGDRQGIWANVAPAVLEGAYHHWFQQMGSDGKLTTKVRREVDGRIELRHGL